MKQGKVIRGTAGRQRHWQGWLDDPRRGPVSHSKGRAEQGGMRLAESRGRKEAGARGSALSARGSALGVGQVGWGWMTQGTGGRAAL